MPASASTNPSEPNGVDLSSISQELERLIRQGENLACEAVFRQFPDLMGNRDAQLELVYLEFVLRRETDDPTDGESLCLRFPELADDIRMLMEVDSAVNWSVAPVKDDSRSDDLAKDTPRSVTPHREQSTISERSYSDANSTTLLPNDSGFDDYQILEKIGQGGMGLVYRAMQRSLNRLVAIKTINIAASFHPSLRARFQAEAELSAKLQHANIVQIYGIGENDGVPFFSMELVQGPNLADAIAERPLEPQVAARLVATLARAIGHAHAQGIIHRDLKPTNILLAPKDQPGSSTDLCSQFEPKIADFGLARFSNATTQPTYSGAMLGTPSYMAPEQISDQEAVGPASDVYSLGAILYTLLIGRPPFHAASALETLRQVRHDDPIPPRRLNGRLPRDLETICLKCLRKIPSARYSSAEELFEDLQRFLEHRPIAARPTSAMERTWKWTRRHPSLATLILALLCSSISMTALWLRATAGERAEASQRLHSERLATHRELQHAQREFEAFNIDGCRQLLDACDPASRHWEWHYLERLCDQSLWQSPRHAQDAQATDISRDGRYISIGYGVWGYDAPQDIEIWDLQDQQLKHVLKGHPNCSVHDVNFSRDGKYLLSAAVAWDTHRDDEFGGVILWNLETGQPRLRFPKLNALVAKFHQDGQSFFIGSSQGTVTEHAIADGKLLRSYGAKGRKQLSQMILDLSFDFNAGRMAATSRGGDLAIWNLGTTEPVYFLSELGDQRQVKLLPDGQKVMIGSYLGNREWFALSDGKLESLHRDCVGAIPYTIYSPDGQLVVTTNFGNGVEIREAQGGKLLRQLRCHLGHVRDMAFDSSGTRLVTCGHDGRAMLWNAIEGDLYPAKVAIAGKVADMVWSPIANEFAFIPEENPSRGARTMGDPRIEIRHPDTLKSIRTIKLPSMPTCLDYSRDGRSLLVGLQDQTAQVWLTDATQPTCSFPGHSSKILDIMSSPKEERILSVDTSGKLCQWSSKDGQLIAEQATLGSVEFADFHPYESFVALTDTDGRCCLWNFDTASQVIDLPSMNQLSHLRFSLDGALLGVSFMESIDGESKPTVHLYRTSDLRRGGKCAPLSRLRGHLATITGFSFSPDNQRVATISDDETVRLFDVALGYEVHLLNTEKGIDGVVLFGRDGHHILRSRSNELASWGNNRAKLKLNQQTAEERAAELTKWHRSQAILFARQQQWRTARFHAAALIDLDDSNALVRRSLYNIYDNRWTEAESELEGYLSEHDGIAERCILARVKLKLNKPDEYIKLCQGLCDDLKADVADEICNDLAWTVCLSPSFEAPYERLAQLLTQAAAQQKKPAYYNTLSLVYYRAGKYDAAIKAATQSMKLSRTASVPFDWLFIELSRARQAEHNNPIALAQTAVRELNNAKNVLQGKAATVSYAKQAQTWLEQEEQKAAENKLNSTSYIQSRYLEIPLFMEELKQYQTKPTQEP